MSQCAADRCTETYDLQPVSFQLDPIVPETIRRHKLVFDDVELCPFHRRVLDCQERTVFAHSKPGRSS